MARAGAYRDTGLFDPRLGFVGDVDRRVAPRPFVQTRRNGALPVVNLGNPEETIVLAVAREIITLTGSHSPITFHPLPAYDLRIRRPDISRARTLLDWAPAIHREEGLGRTIAFFAQQMSARKAV